MAFTRKSGGLSSQPTRYAVDPALTMRRVRGVGSIMTSPLATAGSDRPAAAVLAYGEIALKRLTVWGRGTWRRRHR